MRRRTLLAAASGAALGGLAGCLSDSCPPRSDPTEPPDGWPMAGFDAANTGRAGSIAPPPASEPVWQFHTDDDDARGAASTPVVDDERVFVVTGLPARFAEDGGRLYALERATGEVDWDYELPGGAGGGPALVGDAVLVGSGDGTLLALERATGDVHWRTDLGGAVRTPAIADGWCYVQTDTGRVSAVDVETGEGCWDARIAGALDRLGFGSDYHAEGRPAVTEDTVYVTTGEREDDESSTDRAIVRALERESGDERWAKTFPSRRLPRSPVVADGVVSVAVEDRVVALADGETGNAEPGEKLWTFVTGYRETSAPAIVGDTAYISAKNVYAIDLETGRERWRHVNEAPAHRVLRSGGDRVGMTGHPIVGEDAVYVGAGALDRETGDRRWGEVGNREDSDFFSGVSTEAVSSGGVAITDDALYVSTTHGIVTKVGADA
ncbi:PQQ-binding-like beta-propeller repeat protein [Halomontanus rarus]|uniref:outer membrane protein assembly factor BamB family protein n=1 Tax=Halomontanus rarus TaxID=3034020 RepID=UPI001A9A1887